MRAWSYPGDNFGREFAYPKTMAIEIAKAAKTQVITVNTEKAEGEELKVAPVIVVDETGKEAELVRTAPALEAQAVPPADLPISSNPLPLIALSGFGSLAIFGLLSRSSEEA
jgi:hypothetical protein